MKLVRLHYEVPEFLWNALDVVSAGEAGQHTEHLWLALWDYLMTVCADRDKDYLAVRLEEGFGEMHQWLEDGNRVGAVAVGWKLIDR